MKYQLHTTPYINRMVKIENTKWWQGFGAVKRFGEKKKRKDLVVV